MIVLLCVGIFLGAAAMVLLPLLPVALIVFVVYITIKTASSKGGKR